MSTELAVTPVRKNHPSLNLAVGECIVELKKLKKKYKDMEEARQSIRKSLGDLKPGRYANYMVVSVREVEIQAHVRRAHTRLLLR